MISAKVIADSIGSHGSRITTFELCMPRFILAQFNKHASIRSCAQSSRAIPFKKLLEKANYQPKRWGRNQPGMQPGAEIPYLTQTDATRAWNDARVHSTTNAGYLNLLGIHKQWVNRLLEPFSYVNVVATTTEWDTFFRLRLAHDAQDEMRELAEAMKSSMGASSPKCLTVGEWHLPYHNPELDTDVHADWLPRVCAARCARVSYLTHTGLRDVEKDVNLCQQLIKDKHRTPLEMVAYCDTSKCWTGAFEGWVSLRHDIAMNEGRMVKTVTWREVDE